MEKEVIGVIGGEGEMGSAFAEYLRNKGFRVLIADVGTVLSNISLARQSDIVILSVPID